MQAPTPQSQRRKLRHGTPVLPKEGHKDTEKREKSESGALGVAVKGAGSCVRWSSGKHRSESAV